MKYYNHAPVATVSNGCHSPGPPGLGSRRTHRRAEVRKRQLRRLLQCVKALDKPPSSETSSDECKLETPLPPHATEDTPLCCDCSTSNSDPDLLAHPTLLAHHECCLEDITSAPPLDSVFDAVKQLSKHIEDIWVPIVDIAEEIQSDMARTLEAVNMWEEAGVLKKTACVLFLDPGFTESEEEKDDTLVSSSDSEEDAGIG